MKKNQYLYKILIKQIYQFVSGYLLFYIIVKIHNATFKKKNE